MTNNLNEKRSNAIIVAAIVAALIFAIAGLTVGMVLALRLRHQVNDNTRIPEALFADATAGLVNTTSALRLCDSEASAEEIVKQALIYATRAETALECKCGDWHDCREKEAFLNDASALLTAKDRKKALNAAQELYEFSAKLHEHALCGEEFEYNGELEEKLGKKEIVNTQADAAAARVKEMFGVEEVKEIGAFDGRVEFEIIGASEGYAKVEGDKIVEFSFAHGNGSGGDVEDIALETAEKCGYGGLKVFSVRESESGALVKLCCEECGALCRDECARVVVSGGKAVGFSAGKCGKKHELPACKVEEEQARKHAPGANMPGRLVTTFDGERDRICYEYVYELEDGEHYLYVCAESGEQMSVR